MEDMRKRIGEMTNILRDQTSVKICRVKKAFNDAIGNSLTEQYIMQNLKVYFGYFYLKFLYSILLVFCKISDEKEYRHSIPNTYPFIS